MRSPQDLWRQYTSLLNQKDYCEWGNLWAEGGKFIVVYGKEGFSKEVYDGRDNIVAFMSGAQERISKIYFENEGIWPVRSDIDPNVFFVTCDFNAITTDRYHCQNRLVCRFKVANDKICEITEYADPNVRGSFIQHLGTSILAAQFAPKLIEGHLRTVDRALAGYESSRRFMPMNIQPNGWVSNAVLNVNHQARHIYGLHTAHDFAPDRGYLTAAVELAEAFLERFVNWRGGPPYFYESIDLDAVGGPTVPETLTVEEQAYGLLALVALFKITGARDILDNIRVLHEGLVRRFHDDDQRGFFEHVSLREGVTSQGKKSFNSTVYVATSYLRELVAIDPDPGRQQQYEALLGELADLVVAKVVADEMQPHGTGFIRENFTAEWEEDWRGWQVQKVGNLQFTISPVGHNMQAGWFLLEIFERTRQEKYKDAALATLRSMLERGFDWEHGGVYDAAKREEKDPAARWMWGKKKAWWQQAETIQALLQADRLGLLNELDGPKGTGRQALEKTIAFWQCYQRPEGGTFKEVDEDGTPIPGPYDGEGKGSYHEGQLAAVAVTLGGTDVSALDLQRPAAVYAKARAALDVRDGVDAIKPALESLACLDAINLVDSFGLTIAMRAAAHGRLDVIQEAIRLGASFDVRNPCTNANLMHHAAQATQGGAEIINWATSRANASPALVNDQILADFEQDETKSPLAKYGSAGNGHTVAMEAVFNNNEPVVDVLLAINKAAASGPTHSEIDLTTRARTGWAPRGFALRSEYAWAEKLPPTNQDYVAAAKERNDFDQQREKEWLSKYRDERPAINLASAVCHYVLRGWRGRLLKALAGSILESDVAVNGRYGPLGQPLLILIPSRLAPTMLGEEQQERYGEAIQMLLALGADPWVEEIAPMRVAAGFRDAVFGYHEGLRRIIDSMAKEGDLRRCFLDQQGIMNGYTRLNDAAFFGRTAVIELLLDYGADHRIAGFNGRTPYEAAIIYNTSCGDRPKIPKETLRRLRF